MGHFHRLGAVGAAMALLGDGAPILLGVAAFEEPGPGPPIALGRALADLGQRPHHGPRLRLQDLGLELGIAMLPIEQGVMVDAAVGRRVAARRPGADGVQDALGPFGRVLAHAGDGGHRGACLPRDILVEYWYSSRGEAGWKNRGYSAWTCGCRRMSTQRSCRPHRKIPAV